MTASGTAGYGNELSEYMDLQEIGAIVVKKVKEGVMTLVPFFN